VAVPRQRRERSAELPRLQLWRLPRRKKNRRRKRARPPQNSAALYAERKRRTI